MPSVLTSSREESKNEENVDLERTGLKRVKLKTKMSAPRLMEVMGSAMWEWGLSNQDNQKQNPNGVLEVLWAKFDTLPLNTGGCKSWRNSHKPKFPFRAICYSETSKSCTLGNTPNKISRLEFEEGIRHYLGLDMSWCHVDLIVRTIANSRPEPGASQKRRSREYIYKADFLQAFWPYIADKSFTHQANFGSNCPSIQSIQESLTLPCKETIYSKPYVPKTHAKPWGKEGEVDAISIKSEDL